MVVIHAHTCSWAWSRPGDVWDPKREITPFPFLRNKWSLKERYVRVNYAPFISNTITKEIMKCSRLRNQFLNTKSERDKKKHITNYCVRKAKQIFFPSINIIEVTDNKVIWRTSVPFFTDKVKAISEITLIEKRKYKRKIKKVIIQEVISNDFDLSETFNKFFLQI